MSDPKITSPPAESTEIKPESPPIFALVVGISKYMVMKPNLAAAEHDADAFESFLTSNLHVPPENIISLRNKKATRKHVISAFTQLRNDDRIVKDEAAIVIYFAGHGARVSKPDEWGEWITLGGQIEMLCPTDMGRERVDKKGEVVDYIEGIPDRTVSALLSKLSDAKGDNITLILDCCHSAGVSRSAHIADPSEEDEYIPRYLTDAPPISSKCDQEIWSQGTRGVQVAGINRASHVLLAACGQEERAFESKKARKGLFTQGLLEALDNPTFMDFTYTSLMHSLKVQARLPADKIQTPHCEGHSVHRRLFNRSARGADISLILTKREEAGVVLHAGAAQGITAGSKLSAHTSDLVSDKSHPNPEKGRFVVTKVDPFTSRLEPVPVGTEVSQLPETFYCRVVEPAQRHISIYSNDPAWFESVFPPDKRKSLCITVASTPSTAELELNIENGKVSIYRGDDTLITLHIGKKFPHELEMDNHYALIEVVKGALKFNYHLTRTGGEMKNVWMELKRLKKSDTEFDDYGDQMRVPHGPNLLETNRAVIEVVDEEDEEEPEEFGVTVYNQSDLSLFPNLFYFDPSGLVIEEWYIPPTGVGDTNKIDAPLPPKSVLPIGYGNSSESSYTFVLRPGQAKDVGFYKLFLTTVPADLSNIGQESPFEESLTRHGQVAPVQGPDMVQWATQVVTVVQVAAKRN